MPQSQVTAADPYEDAISAVADFLVREGASEAHARIRAGEICDALRQYESSAHTPPREAREFAKRMKLVESWLAESPVFIASCAAVPALAKMVAAAEEGRRNPEGFLIALDEAEAIYRDNKKHMRHISVPRDRAFRIVIRVAGELESDRPLNLPWLSIFIHQVVKLARPIAPTFESELGIPRLRKFAREIS